jgi:putative SOS response-associated peptidase YedK
MAALRAINAKAETIMTTPTFREAVKYRRCLVLDDPFHEWQKLGAKNKQPFAIALKDDQSYASPGVSERWKDRKAGAELLTFTVIITDPNDVIVPLHDRSPVIIPENDYSRWLQPGDPQRDAIDLLRPYDEDDLASWRLGKAVGNPKWRIVCLDAHKT